MVCPASVAVFMFLYQEPQCRSLEFILSLGFLIFMDWCFDILFWNVDIKNFTVFSLLLWIVFFKSYMFIFELLVLVFHN
ncbi:hypothetical protein MtrunA17_Chr8g0358621 [Medicago truncatula]|uniref:Transmembrane protein n=1 Tax=Medicago truncatula TaxID=3880 RepID=A0A396GQ08_MEDTR|nr:hypothetical protein MtrunA17_Chr8g0358621 [Medicago truncatula]